MPPPRFADIKKRRRWTARVVKYMRPRAMRMIERGPGPNQHRRNREIEFLTDYYDRRQQLAALERNEETMLRTLKFFEK